MAGRPKGEKSFAAMLHIAIKEATKDNKSKTRLRTIADKLVEKAEQGEIQAIREIADRIDGKPVQQVQNEHSGPDGEAIIFKTVYEK